MKLIVTFTSQYPFSEGPASLTVEGEPADIKATLVWFEAVMAANYAPQAVMAANYDALQAVQAPPVPSNITLSDIPPHFPSDVIRIPWMAPLREADPVEDPVRELDEQISELLAPLPPYGDINALMGWAIDFASGGENDPSTLAAVYAFDWEGMRGWPAELEYNLPTVADWLLNLEGGPCRTYLDKMYPTTPRLPTSDVEPDRDPDGDVFN